jgi:hypothetical protein
MGGELSVIAHLPVRDFLPIRINLDWLKRQRRFLHQPSHVYFQDEPPGVWRDG